MRLRTIACALTTAMLLALSVGSAAATTTPKHLTQLAQQQTNLALKFYKGQNVSPPKCGQGQGSNGVDGVFLLPVPLFTPGDQTLNCKTSARSVLVDLGGFVITEDARYPASVCPVDGQNKPCTRENLKPSCDDIIAQDFFDIPLPVDARLDGKKLITRRVPEPINSGVFTARVNRHAQVPVPGGPDLYADSVDLGHPGRLATVYCGFKAKIHLRPGRHRIVVDYSPIVGNSTVFRYNIKVKGHHRSH
jgi:hypothetical protein